MIGNDVVDLELAKTQSNWKRKGYLDKIFTNRERQFILNALNPDEMVWSLWSRKEAVYKIILQDRGARGFYPSKIECLDVATKNGIVQFENKLFYTRTELFGALIHTIAVRSISHFDSVVEIPNSEALQKTNGIPFYSKNSKIYSASKSHHGTFEKRLYLSI